MLITDFCILKDGRWILEDIRKEIKFSSKSCACIGM
jgi:hypothetical protein